MLESQVCRLHGQEKRGLEVLRVKMSGVKGMILHMAPYAEIASDSTGA